MACKVKNIIPNFAPASSIRQGRSILQPAILSRVFFSISLANSAFLLGFRDNISFGITREIEVALPVELSRLEQLALVLAFVKDNFVAEGMCADGQQGQPHPGR